jgi:type II pantothenate kinase
MPLSPFVLLHNPATYVACTWDMRVDDVGREHWVSFFLRHFETILNLAIEVETARGAGPADIAARVEACRADFRERFEAYRRGYATMGRVTILTLDEWRDQTLRRHGFTDPFELLKERENVKMLPLLPTVCRGLDALPLAERTQAVIEGVFAGNIFDMGAEATAKKFLGESPDFFAVRSKLERRPWLVDDFDRLSVALKEHAERGRWKKVVFFVDNAGSDYLLGAIPLMRFLAKGGARVVIAANERPSLNDMTASECRKWWPEMLRVEPSLLGLPIEIVSTGTGEPLIDLSAVSAELNAAAAAADLVVIEGMGRGVESNLDARFGCDALNLAMIKDHIIAARHHGKVFDCVCRFRGAGQ